MRLRMSRPQTSNLASPSTRRTPIFSRPANVRTPLDFDGLLLLGKYMEGLS